MLNAERKQLTGKREQNSPFYSLIRFGSKGLHEQDMVRNPKTAS